MRTVISRRISNIEFLPFGFLLERPKTGARENFVADVTNGRASAKANLALVQGQPTEYPFTASILERHSFSTQAFFPLSVQRYLVVVCSANALGDPDLDRLSAFECTGSQAISYAVGTWHMGIQTLDAPGVFAMLVHEDNGTADCEFREVDRFEVRTGGGR